MKNSKLNFVCPSALIPLVVLSILFCAPSWTHMELYWNRTNIFNNNNWINHFAPQLAASPIDKSIVFEMLEFIAFCISVYISIKRRKDWMMFDGGRSKMNEWCDSAFYSILAGQPKLFGATIVSTGNKLQFSVPWSGWVIMFLPNFLHRLWVENFGRLVPRLGWS